MRKSCIMTGLVSFALALAISLPASAQTSTTTPAPEASTQSQTAPQSQPAPSQPAPTGDAAQGRAPAQSEDNDNPLNLTDEQKAKLQPIIADENKQMDAVRSDTSLTTDQKVQKANQIRSDASPKIRAILTPEQLQKLAQLQEKAKRQRENQSAPPSDSQQPPK
jgi:periplasmic protein CpxP/Spy